MGLAPCKAEQPLGGMELQEKEKRWKGYRKADQRETKKEGVY